MQVATALPQKPTRAHCATEKTDMVATVKVFIRTSHTVPAPLQSEGDFKTSKLSVWTPIEDVFVFDFF